LNKAAPRRTHQTRAGSAKDRLRVTTRLRVHDLSQLAEGVWVGLFLESLVPIGQVQQAVRRRTPAASCRLVRDPFAWHRPLRLAQRVLKSVKNAKRFPLDSILKSDKGLWRGAGEPFFLGSGQSQVFYCSLPFSSSRFYPALLRPSSAFYAHCTRPHSTTRPNTAWTTCSSPQTGTGKHCSAGCVQLAQQQGLQATRRSVCLS